MSVSISVVNPYRYSPVVTSFIISFSLFSFSITVLAFINAGYLETVGRRVWFFVLFD